MAPNTHGVCTSDLIPESALHVSPLSKTHVSVSHYRFASRFIGMRKTKQNTNNIVLVAIENETAEQKFKYSNIFQTLYLQGTLAN